MHTLRRQITPPQRFVENANKAPNAGPITEDELNFILGQSWPQPPSAAHAASELLVDADEAPPQQSWSWFWRSPLGWLLIAAALSALFIVAVALPRPE
jgi:hypothetical protein